MNDTTSPLPPSARVAAASAPNTEAERPAPPKKPRALAAISADLERATALLTKTQEATRAANKAEAEASRKVNGFQLEFDAAVADMKSKAPPETNWDRNRSRSQPQGPGNAG